MTVNVEKCKKRPVIVICQERTVSDINDNMSR